MRLFVMAATVVCLSCGSGVAQEPSIVDLTLTISLTMVRDQVGERSVQELGLHEVTIEPEMTFQKTTGRSSLLCISTQAGTHIDPAAHVLPDGGTVDQIPIDRLMGDGVVIDLRHKTGLVEPSDLEGHGIRAGQVVVLFFNYQPPAPGEHYSQAYLGDETAEWLVRQGIRCLTTDAPGLENFKRGVEQNWTKPENLAIAWPVHKILLRAGIPIIEGLANVEKIIGKRFRFIGLPLKIQGGDGAPVRAIAILE